MSKDRGRARKSAEIDGKRVGVAEAGTGGVDYERACGEIARDFAGGEAAHGDAVGDGRDGGEERVEIFTGAVGDPEGGAAALEAFDGGTAGGAAGSEKDDMRAGEVASEVLAWTAAARP